MKVCLDAGHYGSYNRSPADQNYYESVMVWKLHLLVKKYLEKYGINVILTREHRDTDKSLYDRGAASIGCDLFISEHSNAAGEAVNNSIDYPAAYCAINGKADGIGMALAQAVEKTIGTKQTARIEHRRGQKGDYYGVLRGATAVGTPGLILENSFHTNSVITKWLLDEANLEKLARAQADAIVLYYNIKSIKQSGWVEENGGWRFYLGNTGLYVTNDWYKDGEDWYWFDGDGMIVCDNWKTGADGTWYYLQSNGAMAKDAWVIWKDKLYRVKEDGSMFEGCVCLETDEKGAFRPVGIG